MKKVQEEADQLLKEMVKDLNDLLPEGSRCMELLYQDVLKENIWVGRYYGYHKGEKGHFQFSVNLLKDSITVAKEV
jgi:hypothetical protein